MGSHPGYCYLGGMDPRIAMPQRTVPVFNIPGGAVSVGGSQTSVSASDGPSGWNTIGRTSTAFFYSAPPPGARRLHPLPGPGGHPLIEITATPGLATVQDFGRFGGLHYGVGTAGAMDAMALSCANLLLGNARGAAAIEIPLFPFSARFTAETNFALTGGGCTARLEGRLLLPWSVHQAAAGDLLTLSPGSGLGSRAYLALSAGSMSAAGSA